MLSTDAQIRSSAPFTGYVPGRGTDMRTDTEVSPGIHFYDLHPAAADFKSEVLSGLARSPRKLSPRFFYDHHGSQLFEAITELPEYYPTRAEISILEEHGETIADFLGQDCLLLELGSGSSKKIRALASLLGPGPASIALKAYYALVS